jgi:hypothetical protein
LDSGIAEEQLMQIASDATCPLCSSLLDDAMPVDDNASEPEAGDITVCIYCKAILTFIEDGHLKVLSNKEFLELPLNMRRAVNEAREALRGFNDAKWGKEQN